MTSDVQQTANRIAPFVYRSHWEKEDNRMACTLRCHVVAHDPQGAPLDAETWSPCSEDVRHEIVCDIYFDARRWNYLRRKNKEQLERECDVEIKIGLNSMARRFLEAVEPAQKAGVTLVPLAPKASAERMDAITDPPEEPEA